VLWDLDDALENLEDVIGLLGTLLKLEVAVPERVSEEVEAHAVGAAVEEPIR
jgi:hypothetical protein